MLGKLLMDRLEMEEAKVLISLNGMILPGDVIANKVSFHTAEEVQTARVIIA